MPRAHPSRIRQGSPNRCAARPAVREDRHRARPADRSATLSARGSESVRSHAGKARSPAARRRRAWPRSRRRRARRRESRAAARQQTRRRGRTHGRRSRASASAQNASQASGQRSSPCCRVCGLCRNANARPPKWPGVQFTCSVDRTGEGQASAGSSTSTASSAAAVTGGESALCTPSSGGASPCSS